mgnify:CR=1 FL=1
MIKIDATVAWWEIGQRHIGGSRNGAVCGVNRYQAPIAVATEIKEGPKEPKESGKAIMDMGTYMEPYIVKMLAEKIKKEIFTPEVTFVDDEHRFLVAHIDGCFEDDDGNQVLVECKYSRYGFDEIPIYYKYQINHYMAICKFKYCLLAMMDAGGMLKVFREEFDPELWEHQRKTCVEFWERYVEGDEIPDADGTDSSSETLRNLYPDSNETTADACKEVEDYLEELNTLKSGNKETIQRQKELENLVKQYMGENAFYVSPYHGTVSYKKTKDSYKWKALSKVELTDAEREKFTESKAGYRVFKIK